MMSFWVTLRLRSHEATLELKQEYNLQLKLKDRAGISGFRDLSLEPESGKFKFNKNINVQNTAINF